EDSLDFFTRIYGLKLSALSGESAYLRAWDDYEFHTLKLTRHEKTGIGHISYRVSSPAALERRVAAIDASGYDIVGWLEDEPGHGQAFQFDDPFGHRFELYWDARRYMPKDQDRSALKNKASAVPNSGIAPRRLD